MSTTFHYCGTTLDEFLQAVLSLNGTLTELKPVAGTRVFHLTWHEADEPDTLYGVDIWDRKGKVSVEKGCEDCFNGQSILDDHLKEQGIEFTYND